MVSCHKRDELNCSRVQETRTGREEAEQRTAVQALEQLRGLLPSYRELCGAAPYYYAEGAVRRLEDQLVQIYSAEELAQMSEVIQLQLVSMVHAIREAKGRGVNLDG